MDPMGYNHHHPHPMEQGCFQVVLDSEQRRVRLDELGKRKRRALVGSSEAEELLSGVGLARREFPNTQWDWYIYLYLLDIYGKLVAYIECLKLFFFVDDVYSKVIFQQSFFRGELLNFRSVSILGES